MNILKRMSIKKISWPYIAMTLITLSSMCSFKLIETADNAFFSTDMNNTIYKEFEGS